MNVIKMKIADLKHPEKNVRKHPEKQIKELIRNVKKFGQYRPVIVDENNTILCANGLVMAMREMGLEEVEVVQYDDLSENDKKKLMIADNQTASLGVDDYAAVEEILRSLGDDLDVPGYDEDSIKLLVGDVESIVDSVQSYGIYTPEEIDKVNREKENREENGFKQVAQTYQEGESPVDEYVNETIPAGNGNDEDMRVTSTQKFVVCPHCGEKVYI